MGAFVKKWFHLLLIFVFAYLAGSLAGQANNRFRSVNGIPIYSASADGNWGLSFPSIPANLLLEIQQTII